MVEFHTLFFFGKISENNNVIKIIDSINKLNKKNGNNVKLTLFYDTLNYTAYEKQVFYKCKSSSNIFIEKISKEKLPSQYHKFDSVICWKKKNNERKILDYQKYDLNIIRGDPIEYHFFSNKFNNIKLGLIVDDFTYNTLKYDFEFVYITPDNYEKAIKEQRPDILFVESVWRGLKSKNYPWERKFSIINKILAICKDSNIPTIFWNKEDPPHFKTWISKIKDFDFFATSDYNSLGLYSKNGIRSVKILPFGFQPKMFNPIENKPRTDDIVFAGAYYKHHIERTIDLEYIFNKFIRESYNIKIYDRNSEEIKRLAKIYKNNPAVYEKYIWPDKYRKYIHNAVNAENIHNVYKESIFGLTLNIIKNSNSMFARRIFELMACGTFVISNYSLGIYNLFGKDNVYFADIENRKLSEFDTYKIIDANLLNVLKNHTFAGNIRKLFSELKFVFKKEVSPTVKYICVLNDLNLQYIDKIIDNDDVILFSNKIIKHIHNKKIYGADIQNILTKENHYFLITNYTTFDADLVQNILIHRKYTEHIVQATDKNKLKYKIIPNNYANNCLLDNNNIYETLCDAEKSVHTIYYVSNLKE